MQLVYFPFIPLSEEICFGFAKVWPFEKYKEKYIVDPSIREKVSRLLNMQDYGKRSFGPSIVSFGNCDFHEMSVSEQSLLENIRLTLFVSFLSKNNMRVSGMNAGFYMVTSDNFSVVFQNFIQDNEYVAFEDGYVASMTRSGYKIDNVRISLPSYVLLPDKIQADEKLLANLLVLEKKKDELFQKIIRSTNLLLQSYFNDHNVSLNARILLQVAAFEVLLDLPEKEQRKVFVEKVDQYLALPAETREPYQYEAQPGVHKQSDFSATKKGIWADRIYTLRNHIIHGRDVDPSDFLYYRQRHIDLGMMFFVSIVKKLINETLDPSESFNDVVSWGERDNSEGEKDEGFSIWNSLIAQPPFK
jgi:hypothetical protein